MRDTVIDTTGYGDVTSDKDTLIKETSGRSDDTYIPSDYEDTQFSPDNESGLKQLQGSQQGLRLLTCE